MFWIWMPLVGALVAVRDSISCFIVFVGCHLVSSRGESEILRGPIIILSICSVLSRNRNCRLVWRLLLLLGQHSTVVAFVSLTHGVEVEHLFSFDNNSIRLAAFTLEYKSIHSALLNVLKV
jgi:hypothetical protein